MFDAIRILKNGWLDGDGIKPKEEELDWFEHAYYEKYNPSSILPIPYFYPTPTGNIQLEWTIKDWEITLFVNLHKYQGEYQAVNMKTMEEINHIWDLRDDQAWVELVKEVRSK